MRLDKKILSTLVLGYEEYLEIQQELWEEDNIPYGCAICCGGEELPKRQTYWDMKEQNDN